MKKRLFLLCLAFLPLLLPAGEFVLLVTADLHGELRRLAALSPKIRRETNAVYLDLGDLFQGNYDADRTDGVLMMEALNRLGCRFFVPGNHDFELPHAAFRRFIGSFRGTVLGGDWELDGLSGKPWVLLQQGNFRCALIGLTDPRMRWRAPALGGMRFQAPEKVLRRILPEIRRSQVHAVVLAWHSGMYYRGGTLSRLLRQFPEIDLVIGAHTHEENPGSRVSGRHFVQTGSRGSAAGRIVLSFDDRTGALLKITSSLLRPEFRKPDRGLAALLPPCSGDNVVLSAASADELLKKGAEALRKCGKAQLGLFKVSAPRGGTFTDRELFQLLPYRNFVAVARLTPEELRALRRELAGDPHCFSGTSANGAETVLALSDYLLCSSRSLENCVSEKRFHLLPVAEREALLQFFRTP